MSKIADLRPSPIAGRGWYEGDPRKLARQVDGYLSQAGQPELDGEVLALIAPHAGHIYSGLPGRWANSLAIAGKPGRYMSMDKGPMAIRPPSLPNCATLCRKIGQ